MKKKTPDKPRVAKEDFIEFLKAATPQDLNKLILEKGKPRKTHCPIIFSKKTK